MAGIQLDNLMLVDLTTGLPRTPETGGTPDIIQLSTDVQLVSGASLVVDGDLTVNGTTTTIHSEVVNIRDNHLYLNADYTTTVAQTGGMVVNVLPTATADTVAAGGFTAGVPAVSNPTVITTVGGVFAAGDIIQVSGAADQSNDGIYEVLSHVGTTLTIRGVGLTAVTQSWFQNQFDTDATAGGDIRVVNVSVFQATSSGTWQTVTTNTSVGLTYSSFTQQGTVDLQVAYVAGNTITTSGGEGNVVIAGTEALQITTTGGLDLNTILDFDGTSFDVQMTGSNGFSIDGTAASNVSVTAGNLTLSTITSGSLIGTSAADIDFNATTAFTLDTANAANASGNTITLTAGSSTAGTNNGASIVLTPGDGFTTGVAGFVHVSSPANESETLLRLTSLGTNGNSADLFTGTSSPSGTVTASAGSVFLRDTGTGGEVWVNTSTGSGTTWSLLSTAGATTLQSAYIAGNTITTSIGEGDITFTGTEDFVVTVADMLVDTTASISLDADAASNFTVDGANLTLSTTTAGSVIMTSAGLMDLNAGANLDVDVTGTMDFLSTGAFSIDGTGASNVSATSGNLVLSTITSGTLDMTSAADIQMTFVANNASAMVIDDGTNNYITFDSTTGARAVEINQFLDWTLAGAGITLTAATTIAVGDLVSLDTAGDVILADSNTGTDSTAYAIGVAASAATATNPVKIYTASGDLVPVNFAAAPGAATNGSVVFVSATGGVGTLTAPTGGGNVIFKVGILQGADGADTSPLVLFQPQFLAKRP